MRTKRTGPEAQGAAPAPEPGAPPLPYAFARRHGVLAEPGGDGPVRLLHRPDATAAALAEARRALGRPVRLEAVDEARFEALLARRYARGSGAAREIAADLRIEDEGADLHDLAAQVAATTDLLAAEDDAPVIRLLNALLGEAIREGASDVHLEPYERRLAVRLRTDGVLREVLSLPRALGPRLASRVKVMARLDIAERRLPQDGRIALSLGGRPVDVRVATIPTAHGERVVLRLLDKRAGRLDLAQLGMSPQTLAEVDRLIHRPHGILLVTGPTGSGKTTTLYAALDRLNDRRRNIMTVEDPVEYHIEGISQTQVNPRAGLGFAEGLRAILRQDPDVVMVGEIRDLETARIAVQASLTGHLVLSTLHTNSAVGAVTRLRDMGVEPYLLASSLIGVLAQRLVRLLCPACREPYAPGPEERATLGLEASAAPTLYRARGCPACHGLGYRGRTGIYELLVVDETARRLVHDGASEQALERHARTRTPSLREDGLRRVLAGETSAEELLRVTREEA